MTNIRIIRIRAAHRITARQGVQDAIREAKTRVGAYLRTGAILGVSSAEVAAGLGRELGTTPRDLVALAAAHNVALDTHGSRGGLGGAGECGLCSDPSPHVHAFGQCVPLPTYTDRLTQWVKCAKSHTFRKAGKAAPLFRSKRPKDREQTTQRLTHAAQMAVVGAWDKRRKARKLLATSSNPRTRARAAETLGVQAPKVDLVARMEVRKRRALARKARG